MRILHILDHSLPLHSGYTFRTEEILRGLTARGHQVCGLTSSKQGPYRINPEIVESFTFHRSPVGHGWVNHVPLLRHQAVVWRLRKALMSVIDRERPDILHCHSPFLTARAALPVAQRYGLPLVYEIRAFWEDAGVSHGSTWYAGPGYRLARALETGVARRAHHVTTICNGLQQDLMGRGIAAENITIIPNGVNVAAFSPALPDAELAALLGLSQKTVFGFLGSFYAYEGLEMALRAFAQLQTSHPDIALLLVGGGPTQNQLQQLHRQLGAPRNIVIRNRVPHDQVQRYYALCDVMLYPRKRERITDLVTPLKPLEAMASEKLVLASDVGGHRELIRDGETGYLFAADSMDDLQQKIVSLIGQRDAWNRVKQAAKNFVETERNWPDIIAGYDAVYDKALARSRGR